ncbi:Na+/H+ antiporter NhaC family protein [Hyphomonas oceanitis]|uniref:Na+/H+ antiporter NhaC n=1 Tax=Hyphomonas oceanitis SCH89 TaxID=1280953 RepID=A0A059G3Q3_9PROT|nr:Na+/H+ antiporter NhaC family protein [Hyphomonas oceanitis]KDA01411.1 Na+/H+ antiporter NhaC [Hyphomonas oceanitis SCH89]
MPEGPNATRGNPSLFQAIVPIVCLFVLLTLAVHVFGDGATGGPIQVSLMCAGFCGGVIGLLNNVPWSELEKAVSALCSMVMIPVLLLLSIGGLIAVWIASGVIPSLIVYGADLLRPSVFYAAALVISAVVALASGSAWTTAATLGVALIGIAQASGISLPITAGAIISGVYFGDKLSPLSDTTNLSSSMAGADLFVHVRYLLYTTLPAFMIAFIFFLTASLMSTNDVDTIQLQLMTTELNEKFRIGWYLILPMFGLIGLATVKMPPLPAIAVSILAGIIVGLVCQSPQAGEGMVDRIFEYWGMVATGYRTESGSAAVQSLLSRGGMQSMLSTVWLIVTAMFFSAMMDRSGCLERIVRSVIGLMRKDRHIFLGAGATALVGNIVAADQYLSIVLSTRMYADEVRARNFRPEMLSRTAEDFGTVTSPLVPWNTCGAFMSATLGVATFSYLPFCVFNIVSPMIAVFYISTGITMRKGINA